MKLYYSRGACSLAPRIVINEIGLVCEFESVDLKTKQTESGGDFLKINPKGAVPTLQLENGEILTENAVILQFLADTSNATQLLPIVGEFIRYHVLEWLNFITTELHKTFALLFSPTLSEDIKTNFVRPLLKKKFTYVENDLSHNKLLMGESFTLPDAYLFVMILWMKHFRFDMKEFPNIDRYFSELSTRSSIKKSLAEEKLHAVA